MSALAPPLLLTPADVELASERDGKRYELIDGELREKVVGIQALRVAGRICERLNAQYSPSQGFAIVEPMVYCFESSARGRKPDVAFVWNAHYESKEIPDGDIHFPPDLVGEVLSPGNGGIEMERKLDEYLQAGIPLVWIVNPEGRTIRVYRNDGTTRLYRAADIIENEPLLPGFRMSVGDVFPGPVGQPTSPSDDATKAG